MKKFYLTYAFVMLFNSCEQHNISTYETPNFIFILADDLGYGEIGIQGQKWIETPNIDQ